jgi:uncharacterized protein YbjT (DUF2867 family)
MRIAVAGGTGVVGRYVVEALNSTGHEPVVLSRSSGVDLRTDVGLAGVLQGVDLIVDTANVTSTRRARTTEFFTEVTGRLHAVGSAQGVKRLVTLSIVGIDGVEGFGYYQAKLAQEKVAKEGPLAVTIVRATQFHEFPAQILGRSRIGPVAAMPVMRIQPIAARSVGRCLVEAAVDPPSAQTIEVAGPQPENLVALARQLVRQRGARIGILPLAVPGSTGKAMRRGALLPTSATLLVGPSFSEWLTSADARSPQF